MSDTLCRAATGGGFSKRELYTDDSDVIYSFKRCIGLNGINIAAQRGDLLDRSLLVGLRHIPKDKRRTEKQLWTEFESCKAEILGGFLDTLVESMRVFSSVNPKGGLFRMADFTRWGCAIAKALGYNESRFVEAYSAKVRTQIEEAAYASPLAAVIINYMKGLKNWKGRPSELYSTVIAHAKGLGISTRQKAWPKAPNSLVRQLNELAPSLMSLGLEVVTGKKSRGTRFITINTVPTVPVHENDVKTKDDKLDDRDDILPTSSRELGNSVTNIDIQTVLSVPALDPVTRGNCPICRKRDASLVWQVRFMNSSRYDAVCMECGGHLQEELRKRDQA